MTTTSSSGPLPTGDASGATDPVLRDEQQHLARTRGALSTMREQSQDWRGVTGGDHVSTQYLRQMLYRRMQSLADDPTVPLFFGRIDYATAMGAEEDEVCHIGRRHVSAGLGEDPLVMDWRAPLALPFYRARPSDPMRVGLRRRFGFQQGRLTAYEDEDLASGQESDSQILQDEIERPRTGPMRDIVATIQPDQDVLVRAELEQSMAIQGAPGTGKTAVGLHRAAYLLYAHRNQLSRSGVLVVGPNDNFLGYIADVLPALGEIDAVQETVASLTSRATGLTVTGTDAPARAVLKGDPRLAEVLRRAVWSHVGHTEEILAVPLGHRVFRVPPPFVARAVDGIVSRGVRYEAGRVMLPQRLAHQVLLRMEVAGETTDDRVQNTVARSAPVKALAKQLWPQLKAPALVHRLLTDADFLAEQAEGVLTAEEQALLLDPRPKKSPRSRAWSLADVVLVDEVEDLLNRTPSMGHAIVDEAQDLSAMMLRAVGRRISTGSATLLGDLAQATTPWGSTAWDEALAHVGQEDGVVNELVEGFRVPGDVLDYAAALPPTIAPDLAPPRSIRHSRGELEVIEVADPLAGLAERVAELAGRPGTLGVIAPDALLERAEAALASTDHRSLTDAPAEVDPAGAEPGTDVGEPLPAEQPLSTVELVPTSVAKGLEFDHVLLIEPEAVVEGEADRATGLRRLYVCLTRAVTSLVVLHSRPLPNELGTPARV